MFTFSDLMNADSRPLYKYYIIPAGQSALITGWHKDNKTVYSFLVTDYGKGASSRLAGASRGQEGVLTLTFSLAWEPEGPTARRRVGERGS